jgi:hypothetical protein
VGWRQDRDRWTGSAEWQKLRKKLRAEYERLDLPCARCGGRYGPIRYDLKHPDPRSLVVGHIVSRATAERLGRFDLMFDPTNCQPEHSWCSKRSGQSEGRKSPARKLRPRNESSRSTSQAVPRDPDLVRQAKAVWAELFPGQPYDPNGDWWS